MMARGAFDPDLVQRKLQLLTETLDHLASLGPLTADDLRHDPVRAAATERFVSRTVDLAVAVNAHLASTVGERVPGDYHETFAAAAQTGAITDDLAKRLAPSTGLRNVIVHEYLDLDLARLADAASDDVFAYRDYVQQVSAFTAARS